MWWEQVGPKRRRLEEDEDILGAVRRGETVEGTLAQRLTQYVERIDTDMVRADLATRMFFLGLFIPWERAAPRMITLPLSFPPATVER